MSTPLYDRSRLWYPLDNAARIYPAIFSSRSTTVYRVSVTLAHAVNSDFLNTGITEALKRYPYFNLELRTGFFWHYLQICRKSHRARPETNWPCTEISRFADSGLFRLLYFNNRISLECSHLLTDGAGAMRFLRLIVHRYLHAAGLAPDRLDTVPHPDDEVPAAEWEDVYGTVYTGGLPEPEKLESAYRIPGPLFPRGQFSITTGLVSTADLLARAKSYNASLTEYLGALYLMAFSRHAQSLTAHKRKKLLRPVRVMIPVNLRTLFGIDTMRNFFLSVTPGIDLRLGTYSLAEIIATVKLKLADGVDLKQIGRAISRNVGGEKNIIARNAPLFMKLPVERYWYWNSGNVIHSGILSNLGRAEFPEALSPHIKRVEFITSPGHVARLCVGIISHAGTTAITFGNITTHTHIPCEFFRALREDGIAITIETNG